MKTITTTLIALFLLSAGLENTYAGAIQVGDFRIGSSDYLANTYFDPGFANATRSVLTAPVQINSAFTGTSQNAGDAPADSGTDIGLRTYSSVTTILNINRYASSVNGGASGPARIGIVQWNFDLTPLDSYLSGNGLTLTALDLDLVLDVTSGDNHDVYLSYTDAGAGTTLTGISDTDPTSNYNTFWWAAEDAGATAGSIVNGQFEVLSRNVQDGTVSDSLLALYGSGVREFNLTLMSPSYASAGQSKINDGSGLSITTIPEPATFGLVGVFGAAALFIRRRMK